MRSSSKASLALALALPRANGAWRIRDITIRGEPLSLRQTVQTAINDAPSGRAVDDLD